MTADPIDLGPDFVVPEDDADAWDPFDPALDPVDHQTEVDRVLGQVRTLRAAVDQIKAVAERRHDDITAWEIERTRVAQGAIEHHEQLLEAWHAYLLERDPTQKTVSLPCGTLKSRAWQAHVEIVDPAAFVGWARESAPELVHETRSWRPEKRALPGPLQPADGADDEIVVIDSTSGEPVPGTVWVEAGRSFTISTNPEGGTDAG